MHFLYLPVGDWWSFGIGWLIISSRYLVYLGFAAKAVHDNRKRKRQGVLQPDDERGVELAKMNEGS